MSSSTHAHAIADQLDPQHRVCLEQGFQYASAMLRNACDAKEAVQESYCRMHPAGHMEAIDFRQRFFAVLRNYCVDLIHRIDRLMQRVDQIELIAVTDL